MAAWQRLPAGAACAGQGAPCPPVPAAQDQPLRGSVKPVLRYVLFSCEGARVLPRSRHRFATTRGLTLISPFLVPPLLAPQRVRLCREQATNRPHKQNTFPWRGKQIYICVSALSGWL